MKLKATMIKSLKENLRNWKVIVLVLTFSPFFVLLMKLFYGGGETVYCVGILDLDQGKAAKELIQTVEDYQYTENVNLFQWEEISNKTDLEDKIKEKTIDIGIIIPKGYSDKLADLKIGNPAVAQMYGSTANSRYTIAAIMLSNIVSNQGLEAANITAPAIVSETFLERKAVKSEFDMYVPGLISLAVLMILFTATASIVKENDKKTLIRLKLSRLGAFNFLAGESVVQTLIAILAVILTYISAILLGYKSEGDFLPLLLVGIVSSFSMVAISLIVASFLKTVFDVLTVGCFPFFVLMFFSGAMFPMPEKSLFTLFGHSFGITDVLPLTHTTNAFNQILNDGAGLGDVVFDMAMIIILTILYFILGLFLYQKRKFSKA
jgi:ABC-2 type transport system permease protein